MAGAVAEVVEVGAGEFKAGGVGFGTVAVAEAVPRVVRFFLGGEFADPVGVRKFEGGLWKFYGV